MTNWKTTLAGILLAIGTAGTQVPNVPDDFKWIFAVMASAGAIMLGLAAKDYTTHSTVDEVNKATYLRDKPE